MEIKYVPVAGIKYGFSTMIGFTCRSFWEKQILFLPSNLKQLHRTPYRSGLLAKRPIYLPAYMSYISIWFIKQKGDGRRPKSRRPLKPMKPLRCKNLYYLYLYMVQNPRKLTFWNISPSYVSLLPIAQPGSFGCNSPGCTPDRPICFDVR